MQIELSDIPKAAMPFMQATHLEEVALRNERYALFDRQGRGAFVPRLADRIEALAEHTHAHFASEAERRRGAGFPAYPVHKQAHEDDLRDFDALLDDWRASGDATPLAAFLRETTPGWMLLHIGSMDRVTAYDLAMHGAAA